MNKYLSPKEQKLLRESHNAELWLFTFFGFLIGALTVIVLSYIL